MSDPWFPDYVAQWYDAFSEGLFDQYIPTWQAHSQWVKTVSEDDYVKDGQGGVAGYQLVHIWTGAFAATGADPTRERFVAALNNYENYADLVSGPISFKNSPNLAHGATKMVVYEAGTGNAWRQVGPGFVDGF